MRKKSTKAPGLTAIPGLAALEHKVRRAQATQRAVDELGAGGPRALAVELAAAVIFVEDHELIPHDPFSAGEVLISSKSWDRIVELARKALTP